MVYEFSDEQAKVNEILQNLNDTAFGDIVTNENEKVTESPQSTERTTEFLNHNPSATTQVVHDNFDVFRKRLPYQTTDPALIEQQQLLLDFLITNNICNEENFTIFIAEPEKHKDEAARIVDQIIMVIDNHSEFRQRLPYNTNDPQIVEQQYRFLEFLIQHNALTEENFDIFIANFDSRHLEAEALISKFQSEEPQQLTPPLNKNAAVETANNQIKNSSNSQQSQKLFPIFYNGRCQPLNQPVSNRRLNQSHKTINAGHGTSQYQIDAGQKNFGAQQCKQCGLLYSVHEPEEEKLHQEYHASMHILKFKGWIDEDIVAIYPEWGADGRIIRLSESSHPKRKERLMEILKVVDKELGFSSYIIPKTFVAYFAVRKYQIVGLCLVQPLTKAYKYMCINGVDCCTEEEYEAK